MNIRYSELSSGWFAALSHFEATTHASHTLVLVPDDKGGTLVTNKSY